MAKNPIHKTDFTFIPNGFGHYKVTYTSPVTGKKWTTVTNKMYLTDKVLHQDFPLIKDMEELKRECKKNN